MKKHLLAISLFVLTIFSAQAQIPNPGFETWATGGASNQYENPDNWSFSNEAYEFTDDFIGTTTPTSVVKTTGHTGSFAIKLQNVEGTYPMFGVVDTLPGIALSYLIDANDDAVYFPWSSRSASLNGYYQFNQGASGIYPNIDSGAVIVGLYKWNTTTLESDSIGGGVLTFQTTQSSFASFSVPIFYVNASVPDSAVITLVSSYAQKSFPGTYLVVDDLAFSGIATGVNSANFPAGKAPYAFPNPAKDQISIGNIPSESTRIEVRDVTGKVVLSATAAAGMTSFNLNGLKEGVYIYTILDDQGSVVYNDKFAVSK